MSGKVRAFFHLVSSFLLVWTISCGGGSTQGAPGASSGASLPDAPSIQSFRVVHSPITKGDRPSLVALFSGVDTATLKSEAWSASVVSGQEIQGPVVTDDSMKFDLSLSNKYGQSAGSSLTVSAVDPPMILDLQASAASVAYGEMVSLTPTFSGGTGDLSGFGQVESGNTYRTPPLTADSDFRLAVTNAAGSSVDRTVSIHVSPVDVGGITPSNPVVSAGRQIQFKSSITGAINSGILWSASSGDIGPDGLWTAPIQSENVTITATSDANHQVTASTVVKVVDLPLIQSFGPQDPTIPFGGYTNLLPVFTGGLGQIDSGVGSVNSGDQLPTGILKVNTSWTLTVTNEAGDSVQAKASVIVTSGAISNITPANPTVSVGDTVTFQAKVTGVADGTINWSASDGQINGNGTWTAPITSGEVVITASSAANKDLYTSTKVTVVDLPRAASLIAQDLVVDFGGVTTLTPTFSGGTGVIDQSIGHVVTGQSYSTGSLTTATTYTLTVTNAAGKSDKASVMVDVANAKISGVSPANQVTTVNSSITFHALVLNAANGAIKWSASDGTMDPSTGAWKASSYPGTVTITATSVADPSVTSSTTVKVVDAPQILRFVSDLATVPFGGSTQLHPYFIGGNGVVDQGIGDVTSGQILAVGPLSVGVTYKLTVTNEAGDSAIGYCTVQVSDVVVSGITPSNPVVTTGDFVQFQSNSSGAVDASVLWSASDGSIDSTGLWIAPSVSGLYEITATSRADSRKSSSTGASVVLPPTLQDFTASQTSLPYGGSTNLLAQFKDGAATVDHGVGNLDNNIGVPVGPLYSSQVYHITVANAAGRTVTGSVSISVSEATLSAISPTPSAVSISDFVQFQATVSGALDPTVIWTATGGAITASGAWNAPTVPGKYTITAQSQADKSKVASITLDVVGIPEITGFSLDPTNLTQGASGQLSASFINGAGEVDNGVGSIISGTPMTVTPASNITYTLTVTNTAGRTATAAVAAKVYPAPSINIFSASKNIITSGQSVNLHVAFSGGTGMVDYDGGNAASGVDLVVKPAVSTVYTLTVTNPAGTQVSSSLTVTVVDPPQALGLFAAKGTITSGTSTTLTPNYSGGSAVIGTFGQGSNDFAVSPISGIPLDSGPLSSTRTFTLTVTNAAGDSATATFMVTVVPAPIAYSLLAAKFTVTNGGSTTITPTFSGGTAEIGTSGPGSSDFSSSPTSDLGILTGPITTSTTYTLTVTNAAGDSSTAVCTVTAVPPAIIGSFLATPANITTGSSSTLMATFSNGTGVVDGGAGAVTSGTGKVVAPTYTKTYTLTVTNPAGDSITSATTVNVFDPPTISSFTPARATITAGQSTTIRAIFAGGSGVIDHSIGVVTSSANVNVTPSSTTTYLLTVTNPAGTQVTSTCMVTVVPAASITSFTATPDKITSGGGLFLSAVFSGGSGVIDSGIGSISSGVAKVVSPSGNITYTLTVTNAAGDAVTASSTVNVYAAPSISGFSPDKIDITVGQSSGLYSYFYNGTGVVDHGLGSVNSGSRVAVLPTTNTTYTLTVTNPAGTSTQASCNVNVWNAPAIQTFNASPGAITSGDASILSATFSDGTGSINNAVGAIPSGGTKNVSPTSNTTYTLTVTNPAGSTATAYSAVAVYPAPVISGFIVSPTSIFSGQQVSITPSFYNGTATVTNIGAVNSGQTYYDSPNTTTNYILTVTNPAGKSVQSSQTVSYTAGTVGIVSSFNATWMDLGTVDLFDGCNGYPLVATAQSSRDVVTVSGTFSQVELSQWNGSNYVVISTITVNNSYTWTFSESQAQGTCIDPNSIEVALYGKGTKFRVRAYSIAGWSAPVDVTEN